MKRASRNNSGSRSSSNLESNGVNNRGLNEQGLNNRGYCRNDLAMKVKTPSFIYLDHSPIPNAGLGIFCKRLIKANVYLGTYEGDYSPEVDNIPSVYRWGMRDYDQYSGAAKGEDIVNYVDAYDINKSNWLRYVNGASSIERANVISEEYCGTMLS